MPTPQTLRSLTDPGMEACERSLSEDLACLRTLLLRLGCHHCDDYFIGSFWYEPQVGSPKSLKRSVPSRSKSTFCFWCFCFSKSRVVLVVFFLQVELGNVGLCLLCLHIARCAVSLAVSIRIIIACRNHLLEATASMMWFSSSSYRALRCFAAFSAAGVLWTHASTTSACNRLPSLVMLCEVEDEDEAWAKASQANWGSFRWTIQSAAKLHGCLKQLQCMTMPGCSLWW